MHQAGENPESRPWKIKNGQINFYNTPNRIELPSLEREPMEAEIVSDVFLSRPFTIAQPKPYVCAAIYDVNGNILPNLVQNGPRSKIRPHIPTAITSDRIINAEKLPGRYVYLEYFRPHFGHFLLETLSRAWYLVNLAPSVRLLLHSANQETGEQIKGYVQSIMRGLSIDLDRIEVVNRDVRVDELIVPSPQFWIGKRATPAFCMAFDAVRDRLIATGSLGKGLSKKIYLSRRHFVRKLVRNEQDAEALFASRGFQIITPEDLPFEHQIALASGATHIAGLAGSALHTVLFNSNPKTKLIELTIPRLKRRDGRYIVDYRLNQFIINKIRGVEAHHIFCLDFSKLPRRILDLRVIEKALDEIL